MLYLLIVFLSSALIGEVPYNMKWAESGLQVCSDSQVVFLTDEAFFDGAVLVVQASIIVKVSTVFIARS